MTLLRILNITKSGNEGLILNDISFEQKEFQKLVIAGETGSGKSTLLKIIAGLIQTDSGKVFFKGEPVAGPHEALVPGHPQIAYLSQHFDLQKFLRVEQVLEYANHLSDQESAAIFSVCRIDHLLHRKTDQLSGGEKQRIAIARLLIGKPKLLLLDEPYTNLDMVLKSTLKKVIQDIGRKLRITCIMVSHDSADTLSWANEIIVLKDGHVIQQGTPQQIYHEPVSEYVTGLFGEYCLLTVGQQKIIGIKNPVGSRIVRPEEFRIRKSATTNRFRIDEIKFCGNLHELRLTYRQFTIWVATTSTKYAVGDRVEISIIGSRKS